MRYSIEQTGQPIAEADQCLICCEYVPEGRRVCHICGLVWGLENPIGWSGAARTVIDLVRNEKQSTVKQKTNKNRRY